MYGVQGRSWIAMGDPVGAGRGDRRPRLALQGAGRPRRRHARLLPGDDGPSAGLSRCRLLAGQARRGGLGRSRAVYARGQRRTAAAPGQEQGGAHRRHASRWCQPAAVAAIIDELEAVSDAWLAEQGRQGEGLLARLLVADLCRSPRPARSSATRGASSPSPISGAAAGAPGVHRRPDAPPARRAGRRHGPPVHRPPVAGQGAKGFAWFNLGMAPLAGLPTHRLASRWSRIGAFLYRRGDRFYNFEGLRAFKNKFNPEWRPRYLAYPGGFGLPQILMDVTGLISLSPKRALDRDDIMIRRLLLPLLLRRRRFVMPAAAAPRQIEVDEETLGKATVLAPAGGADELCRGAVGRGRNHRCDARRRRKARRGGRRRPARRHAEVRRRPRQGRRGRMPLCLRRHRGCRPHRAAQPSA